MKPCKMATKLKVVEQVEDIVAVLQIADSIQPPPASAAPAGPPPPARENRVVTAKIGEDWRLRMSAAAFCRARERRSVAAAHKKGRLSG